MENRLDELGVTAISVASNKGLKRDAIRSVFRKRTPSITRAEEICDALGLEFYIGPRRNTDFSVNNIPADVAKDMNHACIKQAAILTEKIAAKIKRAVDPEKKANLIDKIYTRLWTRQVARYIESQKPDAKDKPEQFDDSVIEIVQDIINDFILEAA